MRATCLMAALFSAGCTTEPLEPGATGRPSVLTVTSNTAYEVRVTEDGFNVDIDFRLENDLSFPLFLRGCHSPERVDVSIALERWNGSLWSAVWTSGQPICLASPVRIGPGLRFEHTLRVNICTAVACGPPTAGMRPDAVYRLKWLNLYATRDGAPEGTPIRLEAHVLRSNLFELRGR